MGLLQTPPPKQITKKFGRKGLGSDPESLPEPAFHATWLAAHLRYGAACTVHEVGDRLSGTLVCLRPFLGQLIDPTVHADVELAVVAIERVER
jgi:hypothetical protein